MNVLRRGALVLLGSMLASMVASPAPAAGNVVHVSLWDKGPDSLGMTGSGQMGGMGMMGADMSKMMMGIDLDAKTVSAGMTTFEVVNDSKDMIHEMVVAPVADTNTPLPYDDTLQNVDEDAAGHLGEVAELEPGQSGALRLTLKPGKYILYCNIPGHYAAGMWTLVTVTG